LESIRAYDAAKASGEKPIPFEQAVAEIERSRKRLTPSVSFQALTRNQPDYKGLTKSNMRQGTVVSINIAQAGSAPMSPVSEARAVPGKGLEGDRYFHQVGTYSNKPGPDRELTLIEVEALEGLKRDYGIDLEPRDSRRNIVTRGVPLNHLVGREFKVGGATLSGIRLCEPCAHLEELTRDGVKRGLVHRGGLRAQILSEGTVRVGDAIEVSDHR